MNKVFCWMYLIIGIVGIAVAVYGGVAIALQVIAPH